MIDGRLAALTQKIDDMTLRERSLLLGVILATLWLAWDWLVLSPFDARRADTSASITQSRDRIEDLNQLIEDRIGELTADPDAVRRVELERMAAELRGVDAQVTELTQGIVAPEYIAPLLEEMLSTESGLRLVSLRSVGSQALVGPDDSDTPSPIYRHGFELVVEGGYLDILRYLTSLEGQGRTLYWESFVLETGDWPLNRSRILLYTISFDEELIRV